MFLFCHFFLLDLVVNNMTGSQLLVDILQGDAGLQHQYHYMVGKIGNLVDGFLFVLSLGGNDNLGTLPTHLFRILSSPFSNR